MFLDKYHFLRVGALKGNHLRLQGSYIGKTLGAWQDCFASLAVSSSVCSLRQRRATSWDGHLHILCMH